MHFLERLRAANVRRDKEWANPNMPFTPMFFVNELGGEVGEAQNILKKLDREFTFKVKGSRDTIEHLLEEMADIVICCDLLGMNMGLTYTAEQWPEGQAKDKNFVHDYSLYGAMLNSLCGRASGIVINYGTHNNKTQLETVVRGLVSYTKIMSNVMGLELEKMVCTKFNLTSYKIGLQTTMPVEG